MNFHFLTVEIDDNIFIGPAEQKSAFILCVFILIYIFIIKTRKDRKLSSIRKYVVLLRYILRQVCLDGRGESDDVIL